MKTRLQKISVTGMFCAFAFIMTFLFRFKVNFLTFDFKDAVISITSLLYGPVFGVVTSAIVAFLEFLSVSDTGVYGLIMNFISSGTFAFTCGTIYKYKRNFTGAIVAVVASVVIVTGIMMIANIFITPFYMGVSRSDVIGLIPSLLLPFNLCKSLINAGSLLIIYKPITNSLKKAKLVNVEIGSYKFSKKTVILIIVSLVVIILSVLFLILKMNGSFSLTR